LTNPKGDMSCFSQSVSMTKRNNIVLIKNNEKLLTSRREILLLGSVLRLVVKKITFFYNRQKNVTFMHRYQVEKYVIFDKYFSIQGKFYKN
jgi:hypothetical protein